ncbi:MAG: hypothetical protein Q8L34_00855 [Candidatus Woesearchaeota archaeon]|nr:hypothetical protein [Candidatus Woesearchaeota archaeon]
MKFYWKVSILYLVLFLGFVGLIYAKPTPAQTLFTQPTGQNVQMMTNVNAPQLITALQQLQAQPVSSGNTNNPQTLAAGGISSVVHRVRGSFTIGTTLLLEVEAPITMANMPYILAISFTGDYPGIDIPGVGHIPLNPPYPALFFGFLDNSGHGFIPINIPNDPSLLGLPFTSAVAVHDPFSIASPFIMSNPMSYTLGQGIVGVACCTEGVIGSSTAECIAEGVSINYCRLTTGGAVQNCIPDEPHNASLGFNISNVVPAVNTTLIDGVMRDVINSSISNRSYVPRSANVTNPYICHHFANDLETFLTGRGYHATFTHFMQFDNNNQTINDHALTDVHFPDGTIIFIEPQTGKLVNLDIDGDGRVEARMYPGTHQNGYHPTDDNAKITVYESKAAAVAAGLNMP